MSSSLPLHFQHVVSFISICSALPAGIYTTNNAEACHFVANDCKANVIVVENKTQLDKIMAVSFPVGMGGGQVGEVMQPLS